MMKLVLSLTLIWALSSTAEALVCQTCTNTQCSSTSPVTCPSTLTMCLTSSVQATSSGTSVQQIIKTCAPSSLCTVSGSQTFSGNLGFASAAASVKCCSTDNCNSETLAFPAAQSNNGLQCFSCGTPTSVNCTTKLQCQGVENRCFKTNVTIGTTTSTVRGCASESLCTAANAVAGLPFFQNIGTVSNETHCCGTNLCNTASDTCFSKVGMIHLLLGLLVWTFY